MECQALSYRSRVPRGNMGLIEDYAKRANWAFQRLQQRSYPGKVSQSELGERVGRRVGKEFTQTAVAGWLSKSLPRDLESQTALALELHVDAGWLYHNSGIAPQGWLEFLAEAQYRDGLQQSQAETQLEARLEGELEAEQALDRPRRGKQTAVPVTQPPAAQTHGDERAAAKKKAAPKRRSRGGE